MSDTRERVLLLEEALIELQAKYDKLLAWANKLDEVSDYEYPFGLSDRDDIQRPDKILKKLGE